MRKNPFITVILLILIELSLYYYIDYTEILGSYFMNSELTLALFLFTPPVISTIISYFVEDISYKKEFTYFSIFLWIVAFITYVVLLFLISLGHAYHN